MCFSIAKYLLFAFNLIFWLAGCAILGVGIWMSVDADFQQALSAAGVDVVIAGAYVFIATGSVMLIFGFFGCCGAIKESTCLLKTYAVLLFIVLAIEVTVGVWALVTYNSVGDAITASMTSLYPTKLTQKDKENPIYATQKNLQCCGVANGCSDWEGDLAYGCGCDAKTDTNCKATITCQDPDYPGNSNGIYSQPCATAVTAFVESNMLIIGVVGLVIGLAEILGIIFACCLCQSIQKAKRKSY